MIKLHSFAGFKSFFLLVVIITIIVAIVVNIDKVKKTENVSSSVVAVTDININKYEIEF